MESYELAILLARALDSKKSGDLKVLKTEGLTTLADYFVICTAPFLRTCLQRKTLSSH